MIYVTNNRIAFEYSHMSLNITPMKASGREWEKNRESEGYKKTTAVVLTHLRIFLLFAQKVVEKGWSVHDYRFSLAVCTGTHRGIRSFLEYQWDDERDDEPFHCGAFSFRLHLVVEQAKHSALS